jgi:anaerobic magnesium-protoporphyrin IX monomethyl ester cyclase
MKKVILFNPKSADHKHRIPNSILSIAASIEGKYDWVVVDGNFENDALAKLEEYLQTGDYHYLGFTVMPGPQLKQAIAFSKAIKRSFLLRK